MITLFYLQSLDIIGGMYGIIKHVLPISLLRLFKIKQDENNKNSKLPKRFKVRRSRSLYSHLRSKCLINTCNAGIFDNTAKYV